MESALRYWCLENPSQSSRMHRFPETISSSGIVTESGNSTPVTEGLQPHSSIPQIRALVGSQVFSEYTKISIVRNPFDRAVSLFWWDLKKNSPAKYTYLFSNPGNLRHHFENWLIERRRFLSWAKSTRFASPWQLGSRRYLIRYEKLDEDFFRLLRLLGLSQDGEPSLPRYKGNVRPSSHGVEEYYTPKAKAFLAWYWRADFIHHGYSLRFSREDNRE